MPLPKPKKDESKDEFLDRCMGDSVMLDEYPDNKQRYAVCTDLWDKSKEDKERDNPDMERRILSFDNTELRLSDDDNPKIVGYAAKYGKFTDLGFFKEKIRKGAFDDVLDGDVRCLKNHDPNLILGRTANKTLRLESNSVGLHFEDDIPDTTTGRDAREEVRRGDISGCSFAFTVAEDAWRHFGDERPSERTIVKIGQLFDVGPVTYPAYLDTTVSARSLEKAKEQRTDNSEEPDETIETASDAETTVEYVSEEKMREYRKGYRAAGRILGRVNKKIKEQAEA